MLIQAASKNVWRNEEYDKLVFYKYGINFEVTVSSPFCFY